MTLALLDGDVHRKAPGTTNGAIAGLLLPALIVVDDAPRRTRGLGRSSG